jgi:tryptophan-rich sensory protein
MSSYAWYKQLKKPTWAPPAGLFGPVWTGLYILIAISFGYITYLVFMGALPTAVLWPFGLNLLFNFAFVPIQFGLKNNALAALDVILVLVTLAWAMLMIWPFIAWVAVINIPYLIWVCFATILQITVTYLNRRK